MQKHKKYLLTVSIFVLSLLLVIGFFNYLVDPYGPFRFIDVKGFNQQKEGTRSLIRYVKALEMPLRKPRTILIGSSRVHDGINPEHPLLQEYPPVYNMGINMLRIREAYEYLKHCTINSPIKRVVFGIDFFMFNAAEEVNPSFDSALVGRKIGVWDYLHTPLYTQDALNGALATLKISRKQAERREFLSNGYRPGQFVFYKLKDYRKLHYNTNAIFLTNKPGATPYYASFKISEETYRLFEKFIVLCKERNIDLKIFISPAHANLDGEGILAAGLWKELEEWKRKITEICHQQKVVLWDFSGYNSVTTETVRTPMQYYWDSSHYTEKTSDLILTRLFSSSDKTQKMPADFGVVLTPQNIEEHLSAIRAARSLYARTHGEDVRTIEKIYRDGKKGFPIPAEQTVGIFDQ